MKTLSFTEYSRWYLTEVSFPHKHLHPSQKCVFLSSPAVWHLLSVSSVCCPNHSLSVPLTSLFLYCFCSPQSKVRAEMVRDRNNTHTAPTFPHPLPWLAWVLCGASCYLLLRACVCVCVYTTLYLFLCCPSVTVPAGPSMCLLCPLQGFWLEKQRTIKQIVHFTHMLRHCSGKGDYNMTAKDSWLI